MRLGRLKLMARLFLYASVIAQIVAACMAVKLFYDPKWDWNLVPFVTTVAASLIAWSQTKQFDELEESYDLAKTELEQIEQQTATAGNELAFIEAVVNAENAISREHTMWAAKSGSAVLRLSPSSQTASPK